MATEGEYQRYLRGCQRVFSKDICEAAREYFQNLFESTLHVDETLNLDYIDTCILGEMNDGLTMALTGHEIIKAFKQMDPRKAPGIDELSRNFYKENWEVVGDDILNLCHDVLRGDTSVEFLNETIIVLIPKIKEPIEMTHFQPFTLCRVIYKIVAKVL
ncbi:hypothetical protein PVK06_008670 [Gossypium arboreum]|uniref:Reverse transcriptase n=1 Tax=Gossypium arboreum TaxID=29729 RepID=A0ABR0QKK1_GOSAR|nr:hypothetical protein PVK06_008670 [Gossypium arboreum]